MCQSKADGGRRCQCSAYRPTKKKRQRDALLKRAKYTERRRDEVEQKTLEVAGVSRHNPATWVELLIEDDTKDDWKTHPELRSRLKDFLVLTALPVEVPDPHMRGDEDTLEQVWDARQIDTYDKDRVSEWRLRSHGAYSRMAVRYYAHGMSTGDTSPLVSELKHRGVPQNTITELVAQFEADRRADPADLIGVISPDNYHAPPPVLVERARDYLKKVIGGRLQPRLSSIRNGLEMASEGYQYERERLAYNRRLTRARFGQFNHRKIAARLTQRGLPESLAQRIATKTVNSGKTDISAAEIRAAVDGWVSSEGMPVPLRAALMGVDEGDIPTS